MEFKVLQKKEGINYIMNILIAFILYENINLNDNYSLFFRSKILDFFLYNFWNIFFFFGT